ncbi:glucose dehydrogenase [Prauserella flavalba]|uniref:Glucose dehydrogenase n=2 Tax=Prauserella flavalba TaxID=1477506 RepID=A0A318LS81_9PSEU|nr:glucose dehydrogenase [Prauserella flavalba]
MGMGAATAELFAEQGASVVVADLDEKAGTGTVERITSEGGEATLVRTDVSSSADVRALVATAVERYGRLDCAVNNAAIAPDTTPIAELDEDEFDRIVAVNLRSVALCLKYEIAQFLKQDGTGSIVNIGSVNSFRPQPGAAAYTAAKHGVIGLTKTASLDYAPRGIRINAVCPGAIDTPMIRAALETIGQTEEEFAPVLSLFGRFGQPREVAQASLWLCSDLSSYVTGHALAADGGYLTR